jgi:acyl transferase domain-containing protein/NADPH:quinone reductase-like Zn-dependent oxidoreductase/acyl carrier protein
MNALQQQSNLSVILIEALRASRAQLADVDLDLRFREQGFDSLALVRVSQALSQALARPIPVTAFWRYPTPRMLLNALQTDASTNVPATQLGSAARTLNEPIAVVGIGCRFPGGVRDPSGFWKLLLAQQSGVRELHDERWNSAALFDADPLAPGRMSTRWAGLVDGVDEFEPEFFGISEREALEMDPQQRIMLEVAWQACEDAGLAPRELRDALGGVFIGAMWRDYAQRQGEALRAIGPHTATGQDLSIIAARISYALGLRGPSLVVNTACSSSLVAVHLAVRSLRDAECSLALAGGVSLMLSPTSAVAMSKFGAMSPRGECSAFAAEADGYVRGEGAGVLLLKRLSDAMRDGDRVYGVIRGTAVNNDGYSNGLTAPNPLAQEDVLRAACQAAGVAPNTVDYVETHGPGTVLGDPIEASALGAVFSAGRAADRPLLIGSVKTNLGHLEAAAGMAGLIKTLLCIRARTLVGNRNFRTPNPHIEFDALRLRVLTDTQPWPTANARPLAGVSSFGFGGTNAHVIVEAATPTCPEVVFLKADSRQGLQALQEQVRELPRPQRGLPHCEGDRDRHRAALIVMPGECAGDKLEASLASADFGALTSGSRVVFVFPGQGGQWPHMARELLITEPAFARVIAACDDILRQQAGWSLRTLLTQDADDDVWNRIDRVQPALFAMQVGYAAVWQARGVRPDAVLGHSLGEAAAAYVAGALDLTDALSVVIARSSLAQSIAGQGGMLVARLDESDAEILAEELGLAVAAHNSKGSVVFAGSQASVARAVEILEQRGARPHRVDVDFASHSPQVDGLLPELARRLQAIVPRSASTTIYSSVTAGELHGTECGPGYWARNLRHTVRFWQAATLASAQGPTVFVELSPHPVLEQALLSTFSDRPDVKLVSTSTREASVAEQLVRGLGRLWEAGVSAPPVGDPPFMLAVGAHCAASANALANGIAESIAGLDDEATRALLERASRVWRGAAQRVAVVARSRDELQGRLQQLSAGGTPPGVFRGNTRGPAPRVAFVFPGQGSQWVGMTQELMRACHEFLSDIRECDRAIASLTDWSLESLLRRGLNEEESERIDVVQPVLFGVQVALARHWRRLGVEPAVVLGHSMGEIAAACVAGLLTVSDAAKIAVVRSQLAQRIAGRGAMAMVELPLAQATARIAPLAPSVCIAAHNGPETVVIAGERAAVVGLLAELQSEGVFVRLVRVDFASHSPQVDELRDALRNRLAGLQPRPTQIPFLSTVDVAQLGGPECDASYWVRNLREPVRFHEAMQQAIASGVSVFIEISPNPVLLPAMVQAASEAQSRVLVVGTTRRDEPERSALLESAAAVFCEGVEIRASALVGSSSRAMDLPPYPWQRRRLWQSASTSASEVSTPRGLRRISTSLLDSSQVWQTQLTLTAQPYLADHQVRGATIMPATGYLALMHEVVCASAGSPASCALAELEFTEPLVLREAESVELQVVTQIQAGTRVLRVMSRTAAAGEWRQHASARLARPDVLAVELEPPAQWTALASFQQTLRSLGLEYGPRFQRLQQVAAAEGWARAEVTTADDGDASAALTTVLDACLQLGILALPCRAGTTLLPSGIDKLSIDRAPRGVLSCIAANGGVAADGSYRVEQIRLCDEHGQVGLLEGVRFALVDDAPVMSQTPSLQWEPLRACEAEDSQPVAALGHYCVLGDAVSVAALSAAVRAAGCTVVEHACAQDGSFPGLSDRLEASSWTAVLFACLEPTFRCDVASVRMATRSLQSALQALTKSQAAISRFGLITAAGMSAAPEDVVRTPLPAALWAMLRSVGCELPQLNAVCIDVESTSAEHIAGAVRWLQLGRDEDLVALRSEGDRVGRLRCGQLQARALDGPELACDADAALELRCLEPGRLDSIALVQCERPVLRAGHVLVQVTAAGLNFIDVLQALAEIPTSAQVRRERGFALGGECVGRVIAVGAGVEHVALGDRVVALAEAAFSSQVLAPAALVARAPEGWTDAELASVPIAFSTAYFALSQVGRLQRGERVLIHSAAGGVGLAAVQWAQHLGAEVLATAGSAAKRALLREMGIRHVFDSRSDAFAQEVLAATQGEGVDVVLNALAGESLELSLGLLRDYGRFVELGKRDYYADRRIGLRSFLRNITFALVDLHAMRLSRPQQLGALLREVLAELERGTIRPLPYEAVAWTDASAVVRRMARGTHVGKLVLELNTAAMARVADARALIRPSASYLVTGGLGALGMHAAHWLVDAGARHLVLVGRSAPDQAALASLQQLADRGVTVLTVQLDVSDARQVATLLQRFGQDWPALRGIVHSAGRLDDALLDDMDAAQLESVMAPKAYGALNLAQALGARPLDFFVFYSSLAAVVGSPGQSNYCAANGLLDGLAQMLRARGTPALSVNWGPFAEVGLAAKSANRGTRMESRGMSQLSLEDAATALRDTLGRQDAQRSIGGFDAHRWVEFYPHVAALPSWSELIVAPTQIEHAPSDLLSRLVALRPEQRGERIEELLRSELQSVLRCDPGAIESETPFRELGLDSLLSLELRNRLAQSTGHRLSTTLLWTYGNLRALTDYFEGLVAGPESPLATSVSESFSPELAALSETQAQAQLEAELNALEALA